MTSLEPFILIESTPNISRKILLTTSMFFLLLLAFGLYVYYEKQIDRAHEHRQRSYQLAEQLRRSSDDLTSMVRAYVVTGDPRYKKYFQDILDIRNGDILRPEGYFYAYWDMVAANRQPLPEESGKGIALLELMRQAGFTAEELKKVSASKEASDRLAMLEMQAMKLSEDTSPNRDASKARALQMLYDKNYFNAKASVMKPINDFFLMMDKRTLADVDRMVKAASMLRLLVIAMAFIAFFMLWRVYAALRNTLGGSADAVRDHMIRIGRGDLSGEIPIGANMENSVLAGLSAMQKKLYAHEIERCRAETALAQSLEATRAILETAVDPIITIDSCGIVCAFNPAAENLFGYAAHEVIGKNINMLMPEPYRSGHDGYIARYLREGAPRVIGTGREVEGRRKDDSTFPMRLSVGVMRSSGEQMFVGVIVDLTEMKQAEEMLRRLNSELEQRVEQRTTLMREAKEEAEQANHAKDEFLTSMSHELRTPLNAIMGFGQLLEIDERFSTPDQREYVGHILSAGSQLLGLINDVLDLSAIKSGRLALDIQPLDIARICTDCASQISVAMANQKRVTVVNRIADRALRVQGDDLRLRQVMINLLDNAVKYNKENGRVTISSAIKNGGRLRIEVRDTGNGIARDKLSLLFMPFERIDQKHGTISGVGIGLHIVKQLVEAMHGTLGVESEQGKGSTFWIELPLTEASSETCAPEKISQLHDHSRFVVLYIDDNQVNLKLIRKALQSRPGIEMLSAASAEEGLAIAQESHPELILMDIQLPGIDGIEATIILKGLEATHAIPVAALSADAMKNDIDRALSAGCSDYLTKPVDFAKLYQVIDRIRTEKDSI